MTETSGLVYTFTKNQKTAVAQKDHTGATDVEKDIDG